MSAWMPWLCRRGLHRWRLKAKNVSQFQVSLYRCERCGKERP